METLGSRQVYANPWMTVREDAIRRPDGSTGIYGVVESPDIALLIPVDGDRLQLVEQYRHPVADRRWEFPSGTADQRLDVDAAALAARELREETGLSGEMGPILGIWMDTYAAEGADRDKATLNVYYLAAVDGAAETRTDPNEVAEIGWFAPDALPERLAFPGHVPAVLAAWRDTLPGPARRAATRPPATHARETV